MRPRAAAAARLRSWLHFLAQVRLARLGRGTGSGRVPAAPASSGMGISRRAWPVSASTSDRRRARRRGAAGAGVMLTGSVGPIAGGGVALPPSVRMLTTGPTRVAARSPD
jgi:hypothetical protein